MSLIGVVNSDPDLKQRIDKAFAQDKSRSFLLRHADELEEARELLNFDLPEIVILNASDPQLPMDSLLAEIRDDSWLHNFGIIALFDKTRTKETEVTQRFREVNLLTVVERSNVGNLLLNHVTIIEKNRQIIFQWEMANTIADRITGSFIIENDVMAVPVYAGLAATALVRRGCLAQENKRNLQIALAELIQNGIEHGNCELGYEEKTAFLAEGGSMAELIAKKCQNPMVAEKRVHLEWDIRADHTRFTIRDDGQGFDVEEYQRKIKNAKKDALHGRGILLARSFGGKLQYNRAGNTAVLTVEHETPTLKSPVGFEGEEVLLPQKGDVIFRQGEVSSHLYYIGSGTYTVYHDDIMVGRLTPADIFMGEMSFLMNNIRSATVVSDGPGKIIKISRHTFINALKHYPQYGMFLSKLLARKLHRNNEVHAHRRAGRDDLAT